LWPPTEPGFWFVALIPALIVGYALLFHWRRRVMESLGHLEQLKRMAASVSRSRRLTKAILTVVAVALVVVAWMRPQTEGKAKWVKRMGLDIVIVVDFSKSMYARDVAKSRIDKAKDELNHFIDGLEGDRVGLVAFAGESKSFPLTTDYHAAKLFYQDLTPLDMPVGGTAIGRAVSAAVRMLKRVRKPDTQRAQVIILLTDGEDHQSDPIAAAKMAAKLDIKIFALGIGSPSGDVVPEVLEDGTTSGTLKDEQQKPVVTHLDEKTLLEMTEISGGKYFRATAGSFGLEKIEKATKDLKRSETRARMKRRWNEQYYWLLFPAFLLLLVDLTLGERARRAKQEEKSAPKYAADGQGNGAARTKGSRRRKKGDRRKGGLTKQGHARQPP
jgi:Ca-activated chloride channel family protein